MSLDEALAVAATGDVWLFRGASVADFAIRTVTKTPAEAVGLADRGEIAAGKRADLIRVHVAREIPVVRSVWREGHRVA